MRTTRADVFEMIRQSPAYAQRESPTRHARFPVGSGLIMVYTLGSIINFAFFACISLVIAIGMICKAAAIGLAFGVATVVPLLISLVPLAIAAIGIFRGIQSYKIYQAYKNSPVRACAAIITSRRTLFSRGSGNISVKAGYYVTAEYEDGTSREFAIINQSRSSRLAANEAGVIYTRSEFILDFDRVLSVPELNVRESNPGS